MGQFEFKARHDMPLKNGGIMRKGETVNIGIDRPGVKPANALVSAERKAAVMKQFENQGFGGIKEQQLTLASFDIKER